MYNNFSSKKTKKVISALLASALVVTSAPITANAATAKVLGVGKTFTVKKTTKVSGLSKAEKKIVKVTVNKKKRTVTVKGVKAGKATFKIGKKAYTVKVGATSITKKSVTTSMTAGQKKTLSVNAVNGKGDTITFTSNKKGVVKVNKASAKANAKKVASTTVTAVAEGTAKITAKSKYTGKSKTFTIKVVAATPAPTQAPSVATTPAITTPSATPGVATTPAVKVTATPGTDASATPGTDATATPGADATQNPDATPGADATTTPGTDATKNPDATQTPDVPVAEKGNVAVTTNVSGASIKVLSGTSVVAEKTLEGEDLSATLTDIANGTYTVQVSKAGYGTFTEVVTIAGNTVNVKADIEVVALKNVKVTSETRLQLNFNGEVDVETVKVENFKVSGVTVTSAKLTEDKKSVILETTTMTKDEKYTVSSANLTSNGIAIADAEAEFIGKEIQYELKLSFAGDKTTLVSNGKDAILVTATLYDEDGEQVKDLDKVEIKFTTTAGNFAENRVTVQNGVATNMLTSEISTTDINALVTATVVSASNKNLLNVTTSRTIVMTPKVDAGEDQTIGATLTDIAVETCDRVVLYFNKDVDVADYTKQDTTKKEVYTYDDQKLEVLVQDKASNEQTEVGATNRRTVKALAPVEGNSKALYAILDVSTPGKQLTDNSKVIVKVTDKTKKVDAVATKSTLVSDIRVPSILAVENDGLTTLKITFSEPVQTKAGAGGQNTYVADDATHWIIDGTPLNNTKYGAGAPNDGNKGVTVKVGDFNEETGVDSRNIVTIKLGKTAAGKQIYFTSGSHSIQGNNIGDWANLTDTQNNIINTQTLDFAIDPDNSIPTAEVKVESPEQYTVTFNKAVSVDEVKANLELQVYNTTSAKWVENEDTGIVITPVNKTEDETAKEFVVEVDTDWTKQLKTATTHVNYYNNSYRLSIAANTITNLSNGVKNAEINMALNDEIMTSPDTTSPTIKEVKQVGTTNKVTITMSEPVQIPGLTGETITSSQIQDPSNAGNKVGVPNVTVTFISEDNKTTIPATIDKMVDEHDTSFVVIPDGTLTEGKWKVVVASISDDVGNTSSTQTYNDVEIKEVTETVDTSFKVQWIVAVPAGQTDPIAGAGNDGTEDIVYVKFNKNFKTYGSSANAVSTTNYTINGYAVPTTSKIASSVDGYNGKANTKNNYTDLAAIHLKANTLTSSANTINISSTIEAYAGGTLSNAGMKTLDKVGNIFTYNYKTLLPNTSDGGSNAHTPNMTDTLAELKAALSNSSYVNVVADALVFDTDVYGVTGSPSDYSKFQKAINDTELKISSVGTYDLSASLSAPQVGTAVFKKLTIDTKETGTIRVTGGNYGEIVVNAPNADVYIGNVLIKKNTSAPLSTGSLIVEDVLDGTLKLTNTTIKGDLEIKDSSNGGAVSFGADTLIDGDVIVNTADEVALSIDNPAAKVVIKKAATVDFTNSVKIAKITVDSNGVKLLSDVTTDYTKLATTVEKAKEVTDDLKITASDAQASTKKFVDAVEALEGTVLGTAAAAGETNGATIDLTELDGYSDVTVTSELHADDVSGFTVANDVISIPAATAADKDGVFDVSVKSGDATIYYAVTVSVKKSDAPSNGTYTVSVALDKDAAGKATNDLLGTYNTTPNAANYKAATDALRVYLATYASATTSDVALTNYAVYAATPTELAELAQAESIIRSYSATNKLAVSTGVSESNIETALKGLTALTNLNNLDVSSLSVGSKNGNDEYPVTITGKTNAAVTATINLPEAYVEVQP